jgi:hypothetical protein
MRASSGIIGFDVEHAHDGLFNVGIRCQWTILDGNKGIVTVEKGVNALSKWYLSA